jgi:hypothetical protein
MDQEIKNRWVEALRSGKYKQAEGTLAIHNSDGEESFCCLGVLCEIAVEDGVLVRYMEKDQDDYQFVGYHAAEDFDPDKDIVDFDILPEAVAEWAGLGDNNPNVRFDDRDQPISEVNDSYHEDFNTIATLIEEQF